VIKLEGAGFCHSDIHVMDGEFACCRGCRSRLATGMPVCAEFLLVPHERYLAKLDRLDDVYERVTRGAVAGRV
jgi:D-arabinose 1-dehydrogenase-like Zn-dependent alcohol dehydrogenase